MINLYPTDFNDNKPVIILLTVVTLAIVGLFFLNHKYLWGWLFKKLGNSFGKPTIDILSSKIGGFILLGIAPCLLFAFVFPVIHFEWLKIEWSLQFITLLIASILVPPLIMRFASTKQKHLSIYPQIREAVWTKKLLVVNLICWGFYLLGYEMLFRGFLLFGLEQYLSPWVAIMITVIVYTLVHIPKGRIETLGSIPFGLLLGLISLSTGNFWIAFFAHISLAWSAELFGLHFSKTMIIE